MQAEHIYRPTRPRNPFLLAADIDGTLLGDEEGRVALKSLAQDFRKAFRLALNLGSEGLKQVALVRVYALTTSHGK